MKCVVEVNNVVLTLYNGVRGPIPAQHNHPILPDIALQSVYRSRIIYLFNKQINNLDISLVFVVLYHVAIDVGFSV